MRPAPRGRPAPGRPQQPGIVDAVVYSTLAEEFQAACLPFQSRKVCSGDGKSRALKRDTEGFSPAKLEGALLSFSSAPQFAEKSISPG